MDYIPLWYLVVSCRVLSSTRGRSRRGDRHT